VYTGPIGPGQAPAADQGYTEPADVSGHGLPCCGAGKHVRGMSGRGTTQATRLAHGRDKTMTSILVPFHDDDLSDSALAMAKQIAFDGSAYIEGLFVLRPPQIFASEGIAIPGGYITELAEEERSLADRARSRFDATCASLELPIESLDAAAGKVVAGWHEAEGLEPLIVGERGRLFNVIVIGRTAQHLAADWNATCEAALFDCGRPVVVAPQQPHDTFAKNVVIAWNCSTETARTVAHGRTVLERAEKVTVLTVNGATVPGPSGEDMAAHLRCAGINAVSRTAELQGRSQGEAILAEAAVDGADVLFKGAYTHTRLRQMIFGGATRHILSHAQLPVFMAN
jgi:nucleotide-binding universal stress UspA family protein